MYFIDGFVLNKFDTSVGLNGVSVLIQNDQTGVSYPDVTRSDSSNNNGYFAKTVSLCDGETFSISIPSQTPFKDSITNKEYKYPPVTKLSTELVYANQVYPGCIGSTPCNFYAYPRPLSDCKANGLDIVTLTMPGTVNFSNALASPNDLSYSSTLNYGVGVTVPNYTKTPPDAANVVFTNHTYNTAATAPLTVNLKYTVAGVSYSDSSVNNCVINEGSVVMGDVGGKVRNESGTGLANIPVLLNGSTSTTTAGDGSYSFSVPDGSSYRIEIPNNINPGMGTCAYYNNIDYSATSYQNNQYNVVVNGVVYQKPAVTTARKLLYEAGENCGSDCNFTYYQLPTAGLNVDPRSGTMPLSSTLTPSWGGNIQYSALDIWDGAGNWLRRYTYPDKNNYWIYDPPGTLISPPSGDTTKPIVYSYPADGGYIIRYLTQRTIPDSATTPNYATNSCSPNIVPVVGSAGQTPWWQVETGNVFTDNRSGGTSIQSNLPSGESLFNQSGTATWNQGLPDYGTQGSGVGSSAVAVQSGEYSGKKLTYAYWNNKLLDYQNNHSIPNDANSSGDTINLNTFNDGIYQIDVDGVSELKISQSLNITKAIAIMFLGDVKITGNITADPGAIVIVIASGKITIDHPVTALQGFYIADDLINTDDSDFDANDSQLTIKGGLISWVGINLWRNLSDNANAGELFIQNNDMVNALKNTTTDLKAFKIYQYTWKEVAP